mgnify:CR=1 FL=1
MRVCIVAEGCYPFVVGGVSSWIHSMIRLFPNTEFVILAIAANRSLRGKYAYELPENVSEVYELYLQDVDWSKKHRRRQRLKKEQYRALRSLILDQDVQWNVLFDLFQKNDVSLNDILMGEDFLHAVTDCYNLKYSQLVFSDFTCFWGLFCHDLVGQSVHLGFRGSIGSRACASAVCKQFFQFIFKLFQQLIF